MLKVAGYELDPALAYQPESHLWVADLGDGRARIGFDPLGAETSGDVVAVSFVQTGARLNAGETLAIVEAAKFVGPLAAPVGGCLDAVNDAVLDTPGLINRDPFGAWMVELNEVPAEDLARLIRGADEITTWFQGAAQRFRAEGAIAE